MLRSLKQLITGCRLTGPTLLKEESNGGSKYVSIPHPLVIINDPGKAPFLLGAPWTSLQPLTENSINN